MSGKLHKTNSISIINYLCLLLHSWYLSSIRSWTRVAKDEEPFRRSTAWQMTIYYSKFTCDIYCIWNVKAFKRQNSWSVRMNEWSTAWQFLWVFFVCLLWRYNSCTGLHCNTDDILGYRSDIVNCLGETCVASSYHNAEKFAFIYSLCHVFIMRFKQV